MSANTAETPETVAVLAGCLYEMNGELCGERIRARGYCKRHYSVLNRKGAFKPAGPVTLRPGSAVTPEQIDRNLGHLERAKLTLQAHSEALVGHLMRAAEVAANKGDSGPAQWGLLHSRAVEPVLTGTSALKGAEHVGVRVLVGVNLGLSNQSTVQPSTPAAEPAPSQTAGPFDPLSIITAQLVEG